MEAIDYKKQGKLNKARGARFELQVRADLEKQDWIVAKWTNNIDLIGKKLVKVKNKFLGSGKPMMLGAGFPDFIVFRRAACGICISHGFGKCGYDVVGVESKIKGYLSKEEKEKCQWLLDNKVFSKIWIAHKIKEKGKVTVGYKEFVKKDDK